MQRIERISLWALFGLLLLYCLLRAWFVAPMHDEAATFLHFVEPGKIWGSETLLDANNHLFNSYLNRIIYKYVGTDFFLFRLPNVGAFILYFWGAWVLCKRLVVAPMHWFAFLALIFIHYIFDYFGYTRGYGLAIAFFIWVLVYLFKFLSEHKVKQLFWLVVLLLLCVFSNLTYLVSAFLVMTLVFIGFVSNLRKFNNTQIIFVFSALTLFCLGIIPLVQFSFDLKAANALYYGSLDGFWPVTLKTLSRFVLFYDADWLKIAFALFALLLVSSSLYLMVGLPKKERFSSPFFLLNYLIIGNVTAIFVLAKVLNVNYPEDRAAMYLIPLTILLISVVFSRMKTVKWMLVFWVFFPVSFIAHMSLSTSIFSPDDRMTSAFYSKAMTGLKDDETVTVYPIMQLTYPLYERERTGVKHIAKAQGPFEPISDLILTKTTFVFKGDDVSAYRVVARDPESTYIAYRRKKAFEKSTISNTVVPDQRSQNEFISIYSDTVPDAWRNKNLQFDISGLFQTNVNYNTENLVIATSGLNGEIERYDYVNLRWYQGAKKAKFKFHFPYAAGKLTAKEKIVNVYIWNPQLNWVSLVDAKLNVKELK